MEKIICENCGQEYSATFDACPLCGHVNENLGTNVPEPTAAQTAAAGAGVATAASGKRKKQSGDINRVPTWLIAAICVVLGLAIIIGAIYIVSSLGLFSEDGSDSQQAETEVQDSDTSDLSSALTDADLTDPDNEEQDTQFFEDASASGDDSATEEVGAVAVTGGDDETDGNSEEDQETDDQVVETDEATEAVETDEATETDDQAEDVSETDGDSEEEVVTTDSIAVECDSITLNRSDITMSFRGETFTFTTVVYPSSAADSIVWESSDESMVTVDENGTVNARSGTGSSYVTITATCGDKTATCIVRCSFETADELMSLNTEDVTFFYSGESTQLSISDELTDEEASQVVWSSTNSSVATVDQTGTVTALSYGTANIQATLGDKTATCVVRCSFGSSSSTMDSTSSQSASYSLNYTDVSLFFEGDSFTLSIESTGDTAPDHTWSTSDASVCTVSTDGTVTAVGTGTATIMTTVDDQLLQCIVRVSISE